MYEELRSQLEALIDEGTISSFETEYRRWGRDTCVVNIGSAVATYYMDDSSWVYGEQLMTPESEGVGFVDWLRRLDDDKRQRSNKTASGEIQEAKGAKADSGS